MKVYIFKIFNTVHKLYLDDFYFDQNDAVTELIYIDKCTGKGAYEIHKIHYCDILDLTEDV